MCAQNTLWRTSFALALDPDEPGDDEHACRQLHVAHKRANRYALEAGEALRVKHLDARHAEAIVARCH